MVALLHDRAPVMIPSDATNARLGGCAIEELPSLSQDDITCREVSAAVGKVGKEGRELIEAIA